MAAALERLRRGGGASFETVINQALRRGLRDMAARPRRAQPYRTLSVDLGPPLMPNVDNIAEVLALIEGDAQR